MLMFVHGAKKLYTVNKSSDSYQCIYKRLNQNYKHSYTAKLTHCAKPT